MNKDNAFKYEAAAFIRDNLNALGFKVTLRVRGTILNNDYYKYTASGLENSAEPVSLPSAIMAFSLR